MDKKQKISWGVSFGSLALVAGMTSYLGVSTSNNQVPANQESTLQQDQNGAPSQQRQDRFGYQSGQSEDSSDYSQSQQGQDSFGFNSRHGRGHFGGEDSGQLNGDSGAPNSESGYFPYNGNENQFSSQAPEFGHEGGFDTTTGGT